MTRASKSFGEFEGIELLRKLLGAGPKSRVFLGIGDDAAVLRSGCTRLVWTVDACIEGVHFKRDWLPIEDVGWRSFHGAVSDLAAMGARPLAALSALTVPAWLGREQLRALGRGQSKAAQKVRCPVVGGNITRGGVLSVTTTVLGESKHIVVRSGAKVGDDVWLVGNVGLAAAGLEILRRQRGVRRAGREKELSRASCEVCTRAWRRPEALVSRGQALARRASAVLDVSDGLAGDAGKLAAASKVRVVVSQRLLECALRPELREAARWLGTSGVELALRGGEDYSLLATGSRQSRPRWARRIGRVEQGRGCYLERTDGAWTPLCCGFDHLASRT